MGVKKENMRMLKVTYDDKRTHLVRDLLKTYDLSSWHLYTSRLRTTGQPYHNFQHCYKVALSAGEGATAENVDWHETRLLFLAGLYHDHAHTGRADVPDQMNIARAIRGARFWLRVFNRGLTKQEIEKVLWLIAITENRHTTRLKEPWEGVLRDADILGTCGPDGEIWRTALGKEMGFKVTAASTVEFLNGQHWETTWGRAEADQAIREELT